MHLALEPADQATLEDRLTLAPMELVARWRETNTEMATRLGESDPKRRLQWNRLGTNDLYILNNRCNRFNKFDRQY